MPKFLIVGLGNVGEEYRGTRHNIGFMMLDAFAEASNVVFREDRYGAVAECRVKNQVCVLLKPNTYMNLSGNAVRYWMQKEKIETDHLLVLVDDLALPFGALRLKGKGGSAGHNGLGHIQQTLGTENYARLRFGLGNDFAKGEQVEFVLGRFTDEQRQALPARLQAASDIVRAFCLEGLETAMCRYNNK